MSRYGQLALVRLLLQNRLKKFVHLSVQLLLLCTIQAIANGMTIQYGGSMNEKNCAELLAKENIDGGLIGGASLVAEKFGVLLAEASK